MINKKYLFVGAVVGLINLSVEFVAASDNNSINNNNQQSTLNIQEVSEWLHDEIVNSHHFGCEERRENAFNNIANSSRTLNMSAKDVANMTYQGIPLLNWAIFHRAVLATEWLLENGADKKWIPLVNLENKLYAALNQEPQQLAESLFQSCKQEEEQFYKEQLKNRYGIGLIHNPDINQKYSMLQKHSTECQEILKAFKNQLSNLH